MAFSSRLLSKSKQLCGSPVILQQQNAIPFRYFAKEAAPQALKGDEIRDSFGNSSQGENHHCSRRSSSCNSVCQGHENCQREADLFSESQRIEHTIKTRTEGIADARTYLLTLKEIRIKRGLTDELGAEALMMDALEKVEKELKKPLMRDDKKGMALLMAEFDKINQKLGIRKEDLPKYEEQLELKIAKGQLEELKKDALEAMETQKKREEFKDEQMVDVKSLDIRNFL